MSHDEDKRSINTAPTTSNDIEEDAVISETRPTETTGEEKKKKPQISFLMIFLKASAFLLLIWGGTSAALVTTSVKRMKISQLTNLKRINRLSRIYTEGGLRRIYIQWTKGKNVVLETSSGAIVLSPQSSENYWIVEKDLKARLKESGDLENVDRYRYFAGGELLARFTCPSDSSVCIDYWFGPDTAKHSRTME